MAEDKKRHQETAQKGPSRVGGVLQKESHELSTLYRVPPEVIKEIPLSMTHSRSTLTPICQYILLQLDNPLTHLEILSELTIATNNTASELICHIVAHQVPTHKIRLDK